MPWDHALLEQDMGFVQDLPDVLPLVHGFHVSHLEKESVAMTMPRTQILLATAVSLVAATSSYAANNLSPSTLWQSGIQMPEFGFDDSLVRIKDDKGGGKEKDHGKKEKDHGKKVKKHEKKHDKELKKAAKRHEKQLKKLKKDEHKDDKKHAKVDRDITHEDVKHANEHFIQRTKRSEHDRVTASQHVMNVPAPQGRDMKALLSTVPLALLGQNLSIDDVQNEQLLTYRNCPPGLAKQNPPCVPPGLAAKGVIYDEWVSYDDHELQKLYADRRDDYLQTEDVDVHDIEQVDDTGLLLNSDQVAQLYGLSAAPVGQRYALIDGMPVLLENRNYAALARINDMARVPVLGQGIQFAPTAALTQSELMQTYRLPPLDNGYSYTVLNGEVLALEQKAFETLQLIRIARAVF